MKKFSQFQILLLVGSLLLTGCTSIASKNTQFLAQSKNSNKQSRQILLCRPSAFYHGLNSLGVRINNLDAFDLGSGERYLLDLPLGTVTLQFLLPNQDPLFIRDRQSFNLAVPERSDASYVLVGHNKGSDNAALEGALASVSPIVVTQTTWRAAVVSGMVFEKACGVDSTKTQYLTDKSLN
jgi:hypothetical protein